MASDKKLYTRFDKTELLGIAQQLNIEIMGNPSSKGLCEKIGNILDKGIPDITEGVSDVVFDFLEYGGWIDEEGNILYVVTENDEKDEEEDYAILEKEPDEPIVVTEKLPQCYGYEDDKDPACKRCKVKDACKELRVANRPKCFGKLYSEHEPECQVCIEMAACSEVMQKEG